jgi:hypothetical protein
MSLKLEYFQRESKVEITDKTLNQIVGVGGSYRPSNKRNWLNQVIDPATGQRKNVRVNILAMSKPATSGAHKGESKTLTINCSTAVSDDLRNKELALSDIGNLPIFKTSVFSGEYDEQENKIMVDGYFIGYQGIQDDDSNVVKVTSELMERELAEQSFDWEDVMVI